MYPKTKLLELNFRDSGNPIEPVIIGLNLSFVVRFNSSLGSLEDGFKDLLSLNRTEMFQNLDPITRCNWSLYFLNDF